jgi:hypothetical protein
MGNASDVRPKRKEIRQPIFAPGNVGSSENSCRQPADLDERRDVAVFTVREEVVGDARAAGNRHDQHDIEQEEHAGNRSVREQSPAAEQPARLRPARQRVVLNGSHRPARETKESHTPQRRNACRRCPDVGHRRRSRREVARSVPAAAVSARGDCCGSHVSC